MIADIKLCMGFFRSIGTIVGGCYAVWWAFENLAGNFFQMAQNWLSFIFGAIFLVSAFWPRYKGKKQEENQK